MHLADLADFNTTQEVLDELQDLLDAYDTVVQKPREAISEAAATLANKMNEAYKTLIIFDNLVRTFQAAKPDFVQGYKNARWIVD
ncbi:MAG: hypothetical protein K9J16_16880 [Melioribacteraceae bacterium]|nr:hypothetical protein [Melioribacteraceae bacterium]MCF8356510.1 hypothetical protein [Melioribacteraceae bacterium]MCF8396120.1 hypothetical protein [Melioribacteraceae bacterium]MCF8420953.1 hypothetical protein [Melioribacteraceae bacterium]